MFSFCFGINKWLEKFSGPRKMKPSNFHLMFTNSLPNFKWFQFIFEQMKLLQPASQPASQLAQANFSNAFLGLLRTKASNFTKLTLFYLLSCSSTFANETNKSRIRSVVGNTHFVLLKTNLQCLAEFNADE